MENTITKEVKKVWGFTNEKTTCDCCGRADLKGTWVVTFNDGQFFNYGSTCAFKVAGITEKFLKASAEVSAKEATAQAMIEWKASQEYAAMIEYTEGVVAKNEFGRPMTQHDIDLKISFDLAMTKLDAFDAVRTVIARKYSNAAAGLVVKI